MLNVTIDSNIFGTRSRGNDGKTGIFRYCLNLVKGLLKSDDIQINFKHTFDVTAYHTNIYHSLFQRNPIPLSLKKNKIPSIVTIHDTIEWLYPNYYHELSFKIMQLLKKLSRADYFICPSEYSRGEVIKQYHFDPCRVFTIPLAACPTLFKPVTDDFIYEKYAIPREPYLLSVATLDDRKNVHLLMEAFKEVIESENIKDFNFVIAGSATIHHYETPRTFAKFRNDPELIKRFIYIDFVENEDLAALYSNARATGFISESEGFGFPIVEAMQCGSPVISSNLAALPEVCGSAGLIVDPYKKDDLCQAILNIYHSSSLCEEQSKLALKRSECFSWDKTVKETLKVYSIALNEA